MKQGTASIEVSRKAFVALPKDYAGLCSHWLPRKLHDEIETECAEGLAAIMALYEEEFTPDQRDFFELLCTLIAERHVEAPEPWPQISPEGMLQHLAKENNLSGAEVARILGAERSLGDKLMRGERRPVKHIQRLASHFGLSADAFIPTSYLAILEARSRDDGKRHSLANAYRAAKPGRQG